MLTRDFLTKSKLEVESDIQSDVILLCDYISNLTMTKKYTSGTARFRLIREVDQVTNWLYSVQFATEKEVNYEENLVLEDIETVGNYKFKNK